jgi:hypothetical protein
MIGTPKSFPPAVWPASNFFPTTPQTVQFVSYNSANGGNYRLLSSSKYANAGTDGKNLGANIDQIDAATAGVSP